MTSSTKMVFLLRTFLILLLVELLIIPLLHLIPLHGWPYEVLVNVVLLMLISYPLLSYFVIAPLEARCRQNHEKLHDAKVERNIAGKLEERLIHEIEFQNSYNRAILDGEPSIVIVTDGRNTQDVNRAFLNFFSEYENLEAFKKEHDCICDFFEVIKEEDFVYKDIDGTVWSDYILSRPDKQHKVAIRRGEALVTLSVRAQQVLFEDTDLVVISFHDITLLEKHKNHLKTVIQEQTAALQQSLKTLQESEKKLHAITDSVQDAIILLDERGVLSFMNPAAKHLLGYEEKELEGKDFHKIVAPPEYYSAFKKGYAGFAKTGEGKAIGKTLELTAIRKDGTHFPVSLSLSRLKLEGRWHGLGLMRDITGQKRYETAILEAKNRLEAAVRTSGVGIYDYTIPMSEHSYWSEEWAQILGYAKAELPSWDKMVDWIRSRIHPEDRDLFDQNFYALITEGESYNVKKRMRHKNGHWLTISSIAEVVEHDEKGRPIRAIGAIRDISASVILLEELRHSKERFQSLVEDMNDWIWEVNAKGQYTYVSPKVKEILGYEPEEIIGETPFELMPHKEAERLKSLFSHLLETKKPFDALENTNLHKNGNTVILESSGKPILDAEGEVIGYRGIDRDITDRKRLEEELHRKEELMIAQSRQAAMGDMIAMIAHQWRQPITVVGMAVNNLQVGLALDQKISQESLEKMIATVSHQVQHLSKTIDDFRNFFKPNKQKEYVRICDVIDDTMRIIGKSLENNDIHVDYNKTCQRAVYTFPNELLQVYLNLLANAKDAIKEDQTEGAKITMWIEETPNEVHTHICDNGGGIPEEIITKLGEPYLTSKEENGTGLGIYMSKIIVEKHMGGSLRWENRNDGACFTVSLPLDKDATK